MTRTGATAVVADADVWLTLLVTTVDDVAVAVARIGELFDSGCAVRGLGLLAELVVVARATAIALTVVSTGGLVYCVAVVVNIRTLRHVLTMPVAVTCLA
jgi:hypothetical protein